MPTLTKIGRNTIHDSAVSTAQLEDGQVLLADIGSNAVGNDELLNSDSFEMNGLIANGTSALKGQVTMNSSSSTFSFPTGRPATNQILKASDANGTLAWDVVSVTGYSGVAWSYNVTGGANETIPVNKAIVVPGPLEISNGTVTVQGRLHVI
tara:strand:- start:193 stop:648 length:456 start_codon:yes stop_codon:yes gene_type:complete